MACGSGSALYLSADGGLNWRPVPGVLGFFTSAASSADGSRLVVVSNGGQIDMSMDSGATWFSNSAPVRAWQEVAASSDGNVVVTAAPGDQIYTLHSAPTLSLVINNGQRLLSWPWPSSGYVLQSNTDLSTTNWQIVLPLPLLLNWRFQLPVLSTGPQIFFRLHSQLGGVL